MTRIITIQLSNSAANELRGKISPVSGLPVAGAVIRPHRGRRLWVGSCAA
jgi:hypothetical protein